MSVAKLAGGESRRAESAMTRRWRENYDQLIELRTLPCFSREQDYLELLRHLEQAEAERELTTTLVQYPEGLVPRGNGLIRPDDLLLLPPGAAAPDAQSLDRSGETETPARPPAADKVTPPATVETSPASQPVQPPLESLPSAPHRTPNQTPSGTDGGAQRFPRATGEDELLTPDAALPAAPALPPSLAAPPAAMPPTSPLPQPPMTGPLRTPPTPLPTSPPGPASGLPRVPPSAPSPSPMTPRAPTGNFPGAPHGPMQRHQAGPSTPGDPHRAVFECDPFPSATSCKKCHEKIFHEWSMSSHAYAAVSPMFHKFEQKINDLTRGTLGYFCMRCHSPVGTTLKFPRNEPIFHSVPAAAEGVTCVACHRVKQRYGRVNGERRVEPGDIYAPVFGGSDGAGLQHVLANKSAYKVKTHPGEKGPGQPIHTDAIQFEQLSSSHFCVSCHQVAVFPGIKLEVVWEQYRASPARRQGITCQNCHMGANPGRADGYECGPAAIVADKPVNPQRKHSNHIFHGPGYSIAHPGTFPINPKAQRWNYQQWLCFDWRAGWGTEAFEQALEQRRFRAVFPPEWSNVDDRYDAREVVEENLKRLQEKRESRQRVMENGSKLEGPFFTRPRRVGQPLHFNYLLTNMNGGHNFPTGSLGAQPQIWLNVALTGPDGCRLWESGYLDANGDIADRHSLEVAAGRIRHDDQLFNLQTKFLTTNLKGTDREMYLPVNLDVDQLPFIRPSGFPITTMNHPPLIRMEAHSLPPLAMRRAKYRVPADVVKRPGRYRLSVRMRSRAEPIYFMKFVGATDSMVQAMNERMLDFHAYAVEFEIKP
ncbi:MAG: hypothetical protein KDB14_17885 [Planctomycetales bacterium]|nr:hypothetical protein [Planctomycetales bacterium]